MVDFNFSLLPWEVLKKIFENLDQKDLTNVKQVCSSFSQVASEASLWPSVQIGPNCLTSGVSFHQIFKRFPRAKKLTILSGLRVTKSLCARIKKDLPKLTKLCVHLCGGRFYSVQQELTNICDALPHLLSLEIHQEQCKFYTIDTECIKSTLTKLEDLEEFGFYQSGPMKNDCAPHNRVEINSILTQISSNNKKLKKFKVDVASYHYVRRFSIDGLTSFAATHGANTKSFHVKHCLLTNSCLHFLHTFVHLRHLGLRCVEGLLPSDWRHLFLRDEESEIAEFGMDIDCLAFPYLESLEMDVPGESVLRVLSLHYGHRLKKLFLAEYTMLFTECEEAKEDSIPIIANCLKQFVALTTFSLGVKPTCCEPRVKRLIKALLTISTEFSCDFHLIEL